MCVCLCVCTYKAVSSGFAGLSVRYHHRLVDVPEGLEVFPEGGIVGVVRQPADEDLGEGGVFLQRGGMHGFQGSVHQLVQKHRVEPERDGPGGALTHSHTHSLTHTERPSQLQLTAASRHQCEHTHSHSHIHRHTRTVPL